MDEQIVNIILHQHHVVECLDQYIGDVTKLNSSREKQAVKEQLHMVVTVEVFRSSNQRCP